MKKICEDCSLKKIGCLTGEGTFPASIMIIADRPTLEEVNNKTGFSGKANEQINSYLTLAEIPLDIVYKTYIVKGYVKSGATVSIVSIRKCIPHLIEEIKLVKPKVIILLGATAYKGFKGKSGVGTYYYDEEFNAWIVYSSHPLKPIYSGQEEDYIQLVAHFKLAKELVTRNSTQTLAKPNITIIHNLAELLIVKPLLILAEECGVDCETTGLNIQKDNLITIGFATNETAIGVIYRPEMQQDLQDIFNVRKIIGHNLKFDIQVLRKHGLIAKNIVADTLLEHYVLEPISTSRDLVSLCLKEFQTTFEKNIDYSTLFINGVTPEIENILAERGALDAYLSFLLHKKFIAKIRTDSTMNNFFSTCVMPILDLLCEIEFNGIHIDQNELFSAETILNYELKAREADILTDPVVQHFAQKESLTEINLGSPKQMSTLIYKYLHFPVLKDQGKSTAKDVIEKLNETQKNPFITKLLEYRNMAKLRDTYIKGLKEALDRSGEDRVHVQYNQTVVVTGRLSCFPAGTLVRKICGHKGKRGGSTSEYCPIEDLHIGDNVYTHLGKAHTITNTMCNDYYGELVKIVLPWRGLISIPRTILVTPEHPFLTDMGWIKAKDITMETVLYTYQDINPQYKTNMQHTRNGGARNMAHAASPKIDPEVRERLRLLRVNGISPLLVSRVAFKGKVYNIAVQEAESYFVQGLIAHNCSAPNLQTIPKAVENAKTIRKMFGARPGYSLVEMDFKQLEFRIWAHLSKDAAMLNMLATGGDIHKKIASLLNNITEDLVTEDQRYQAKEICFGLIYGMGVATMSARTGVSIEEATRIKNDFFATFPEATIWIKQVQDFGLKHKYVLTPFGRKIPIIYNPNDKEQVSSAQRHAVNYPIQSAGGDLTNITGVYLKQLIIAAGIDARIVLNVHDSLVWEVKDEEIIKFKPVALEAIKLVSTRINFRAFLQASFTHGKNLGELVEF